MKGALPTRTAKTPTRDGRCSAARWLKFNVVGGIGIGVQLAVLLSLKSGFHLGYLLATALAVEVALVHNFLWHERFTWADRVRVTWRQSLLRLLRFNFTTGAVSIFGNVALMKLLVDAAHLNYLMANAITIPACSVVNFVVSDRFVFGERRPVVAQCIRSPQGNELNPKSSAQPCRNSCAPSVADRPQQPGRKTRHVPRPG
jgi:putative flippase GtrA